VKKLTRVLAATGVIAMACTLILAAGPAMENGARAAAIEKHAFDVTDLDRTCPPCQDFYKFATGGWTTHNPIQPAYARWGRFDALQNSNQEILRQILESAARVKNAAPGSVDQKIGDFYASCMDTTRIEADGIKPIEPELARVDKLASVADIPEEVAHLQNIGVNALFFFGSSQDDKNSTEVIADAEQGGLGLPDRDYYTNTDDKSRQMRDKYEQHVARMLALAGDAPEQAAAEAHTVLAIETQLAQVSKTAVELRDPEANYHKMAADEVRALTPDFSWETYFRDTGFPDIREVDVRQPEFFEALDKDLAGVALDDWKTYFRWHILHAAAAGLSEKFVDENFDFFGRTLTGAQELQPRWKRCVSATDSNLGEALGQKYVARNFPPAAKERARAMVQNLVQALRADIETLPWMSPPTREQALAKLSAMALKIGYPDKWRDYSSYQVTRGPYVENLERGSAFEFHRDLAKIGKPVDRGEWEMTPPTVNAYYEAAMNEIVFPAGILQTPFFDAKADDALNYGGIGAVIGHEMTHGFDDQGRQYDAQGNLRNWWTPEDQANFEARAQCVEKQFDSFVVEGDLHENGKLVLGESIADLGGLTIAHLAFEASLAGKPVPAKIDGFTAEQRFYLEFARIWGSTERLEYQRNMTVVNPHPLPRFRATAPLTNMPEFAAAFSCQAGDPMVRPAADRCKIW
jgi:putative endopeptidase